MATPIEAPKAAPAPTVKTTSDDPKRSAAAVALQYAMMDDAVPKNELKKCIARAGKAGVDTDVLERARQIKSTRLSEAQRSMKSANSETRPQPVPFKSDTETGVAKAEPSPPATMVRAGRISFDRARVLYECVRKPPAPNSSSPHRTRLTRSRRLPGPRTARSTWASSRRSPR